MTWRLLAVTIAAVGCVRPALKMTAVEEEAHHVDARAFWAKKVAESEAAEEARTGVKRARKIELTSPPLCGARNAPTFRDRLLGLQSPPGAFEVYAWGKEEYWTRDPIVYHVQSSKAAFVTLYWIGPEGSVFIPFMNLEVDANREFVIDPSNIIVEPVGLERWRLLATPERLVTPCQGSDAAFVEALDKALARGGWAVAPYDVLSRVRPPPPTPLPGNDASRQSRLAPPSSEH